MYLLANQWVKPVTRGNAAGFASTFHTTLDATEKQRGNPPERKGKQKGKGKQRQQQQQGGDAGKKPEKDPVECFACGELGHYANTCPQRKQNKNSQDDSDDKQAHATWDASTFVTYQVNATGMTGKFKTTELLLDNQADVSIVHPSLLQELQQAEKEVNINGVGGLQFTVHETGFLDELFRVYASEDTHANVLSFAKIEY
jgi:hypothetical protein